MVRTLNTALGNGPNAEHCAWNELEMIFSTVAQVLASCPQSSADKISPELKWFSQVVDVRPRDSLNDCYRPARDTRCLERGEGEKGELMIFFYSVSFRRVVLKWFLQVVGKSSLNDIFQRTPGGSTVKLEMDRFGHF